MTKHARILIAAVALLTLALPAALAAEEKGGATRGEVIFGPNWYVDEAQQRDSAKFLEYRDVPNSLILERLLFSREPKPGYTFDIDAYDIGQQDMHLTVRFGKADLWKGFVKWQENPRRWTDQASMLWADAGGGVFTLDDAFQSAVQGAPASVDTTPVDGQWDAGTKGYLIKNAILNSADDVFVGSRRRTGLAGFEWTPTRSWMFGISGQSELRSGTAPQSLGMYFTLAPAEVAAPLDFRTDTGVLKASFTRQRFTVGAELTASRFETGYKSLTWDDQLYLNDTAVTAGLTSNPARGRMNLGVDNDMTRMSLYGGVNLPGHTRINASASRSETTQNDPFLGMTSNAALGAALLYALPAASFDGKYQNNLYDVRATSRPLRWFRWGAWARRYEYDNESPSLAFGEYVQTDVAIPLCANANSCGATTNRLARRNLPQGYERTNMGALVGFEPFRWWDVALSYDREKMKREHSAVEDSDEDSVKLVMDFDVADWLNVRTTARHQERRADAYDAEYNEESFPIGEQYVAAVNEGGRRFYWTDRDRDFYSLLVDVTPNQKFSVYAEAIRSKDTYLDPLTGRKMGESYTVSEDRDFNAAPESYTLLLAGRTGDDARSYTLGVSFAPVPRFSAYADYTWEKSTYGLETRYRCPASSLPSASCPGATFVNVGSDSPLDDWGSDMDDRYKTASLGAELQLTKRGSWKASADYSRSEGAGTIDTHFVTGGAPSSDTNITSFPELKTTLDIGRLSLTHSVSRSFDYMLRYWYESWQEDNFASDFMQPYMGDPGNDPGSSNAAYLGMDYKNYKNHIVSFLLRYRFD